MWNVSVVCNDLLMKWYWNECEFEYFNISAYLLCSIIHLGRREQKKREEEDDDDDENKATSHSSRLNGCCPVFYTHLCVASSQISQANMRYHILFSFHFVSFSISHCVLFHLISILRATVRQHFISFHFVVCHLMQSHFSFYAGVLFFHH